jgi:predicted  nucleic acid-binding Zn-ribbon protein
VGGSAGVPRVRSYATVDAEGQALAPEGSLRGMDRLLQLQELDLSIDRLTARLRELEGGEELRSIRTALGEAEARLGELRLAMDSLGREQRRLEGDIDSMERKIQAERRRMLDGSVANPKELQSIEAEVRNLGARKSHAEDLVLEQMERGEDLHGRLGPLEADEAEARQRLASLEEGSARELVELERALGERRAERAVLVQAFEPELLELYEELRRQKKGIGAAALVDGVCQACHQKLSPMYIDRLKRIEGVRRCEYCRRILVF